ncbi:MAG TPA: hypothetical protein PLI77_02115 [Bacteroidales bacterium]|nr:hypothetical protein [Bacteroidales bacterium]
MIDPCDMYWDLPDAKTNLGKFCFVVKENVIYQAKKIESESEDWLYGWRIYAGNINILNVGSGTKTELKSKVSIPYLKRCGKYDTFNLVPVIPKKGYSPIFNASENSDFEMIFLTHYNNEKFWLSSYSSFVYKECFRPAVPDQAPGWAAALSPIGEKSSGELLIAPWLEYISNYDKVTHKFAFPIAIFLEVISLLKPQENTPEDQKRYLLVNGSKLMPIKMEFQFRADYDKVLTKIEFAILNLKI